MGSLVAALGFLNATRPKIRDTALFPLIKKTLLTHNNSKIFLVRKVRISRVILFEKVLLS